MKKYVILESGYIYSVGYSLNTAIAEKNWLNEHMNGFYQVVTGVRGVVGNHIGMYTNCVTYLL